MALQNRVTPLGELIPAPTRGLVYGNRGCLHDDHGNVRRRWAVRRWIACRLEFKGWQRGPMMQPGKFTELFFADEATAFAAGHRPCALCRREDYDRFGAIWAGVHGGETGADVIDLRLHGERVDPETRAHRTHTAPFASLPDGAFVLSDGDPYLVLGRQLLLWSPSGYAAPRQRPAHGTATVITPPSLVEVLRAGWRDAAVPLLHPSIGEVARLT
jgi:hypothetical protein